MAIPNNIFREHIFQAIIKIKDEGIPPRRGIREWAMIYNGKQYPCKLLISWGNLFANGVELNPNPKIFTTYIAQDYLQKLNFEIIKA